MMFRVFCVAKQEIDLGRAKDIYEWYRKEMPEFNKMKRVWPTNATIARATFPLQTERCLAEHVSSSMPETRVSRGSKTTRRM